MKVINFFGAPGVGKTTTAMWLTSSLKKMNIDAEISLEFVKEYILSGNDNLLAYQNYIFAQQDRQLRILQTSQEVEFAVTDAPLLHSAFYEPEKYPIYFKDLVFEIFNSYDNINFFIKRNHPYSHQARIHDEKKSDYITKKLPAFLRNYNIPFIEINSTDDMEEKVLTHVLNNRVTNYQRKERGSN